MRLPGYVLRLPAHARSLAAQTTSDGRVTRSRLARRLAAYDADVAGDLHLRWLDEALSLDGLDTESARLDELERLVTRVESGEPLAYVIGASGHRVDRPSDRDQGHQPFGGLKILTRPPTLIPRSAVRSDYAATRR